MTSRRVAHNHWPCLRALGRLWVCRSLRLFSLLANSIDFPKPEHNYFTIKSSCGLILLGNLYKNWLRYWLSFFSVSVHLPSALKFFRPLIYWQLNLSAKLLSLWSFTLRSDQIQNSHNSKFHFVKLKNNKVPCSSSADEDAFEWSCPFVFVHRLKSKNCI